MLAQIDPRTFQAQLAAAVKTDEALANVARVQLDYTTITAPLSGRVGARPVDPGNIVHAADANGLVVIRQIDPIDAVFTLPDGEFQRINGAMQANGAPLSVQASERASGQLPGNLPTPPTFRKINPADSPILVLAVQSDTLPLTEVNDFADNVLAQQISQIFGVGLVNIGGQQKPSVRIQVDPQKLSAMGMSLEDLRSDPGLDAQLYASASRRSEVTEHAGPSNRLGFRGSAALSCMTVQRARQLLPLPRKGWFAPRWPCAAGGPLSLPHHAPASPTLLSIAKICKHRG
ncbi:Acriflavin resistance protein [Cupriavidus basilensis]|uniref:Acriflavin resistance protein n=1 Tax=Cupriavidus basilensis TaxID=68895 RepID=A0A0C4Y5T1_9BURK|nr:Acriflavin resistance protein [Cupriavidus basilensis]